MFQEVSFEDLDRSTRDDDAARLKRIPMGPSSPGWRAKIQPPEPDGTEQQLPPEEDLTQNILERMRQMAPPPSPVATPGTTLGGRRVAFYYGRNSDYIVCVESAPEGDIIKRFKFSETEARAVYNVCRAFGIYQK